LAWREKGHQANHPGTNDNSIDSFDRHQVCWPGAKKDRQANHPGTNDDVIDLFH